MKALDELRKIAPLPGPLAATKHEDHLTRHAVHAANLGNISGDYFRGIVSRFARTEPLSTRMVAKRIFEPAYQRMLRDGTLSEYALEAQLINTENPSFRYSVLAFHQRCGDGQVFRHHKAGSLPAR